MPNIDKLAATGTRFNQSYAGSGISSPSRCALMTGKNTGNSRIRDNMCTAGGLTGLKNNPNGDTTIVRRTSLQPQDTTIATVLHAAGYKTCLVNKWHLDGYDPKSSPIYRGFDEFHGWLISTVESNSPYYYPYNRFDDDKLIHIKANANTKKVVQKEVPVPAKRYAEELMEEVNADREAHGKKPFLARTAYKASTA